MSNEKAWVYSDGYGDYEGVIAGNRTGLEKLKSSLTEALECPGIEVRLDVEDTDIGIILLTDKEKFINNNEYKETLKGKLIKYIIVSWFVVLPFVGIGFLGNWIYNYETKIEYKPLPLNPAIIKKNKSKTIEEFLGLEKP